MEDIFNLSFDDIVNKPPDNEVSKKETLEKRFTKERLEWSNKIDLMSKKMKDITKINELMVEVYSERQIAVEYYHYLISILSKLNKNYRAQWAQKYDYYSYKSQQRFPNEKLKERQILSEIAPILSKREDVDNHSKFIDNTIKTIDNIIYGIKYRIELENIARGK